MAMLPVEVIMHRPVKKDSSLERLFLAMILRKYRSLSSRHRSRGLVVLFRHMSLHSDQIADTGYNASSPTL